MAGNMNVDSAAGATADPTMTPSMVAERPVGETQAGAHAEFQPMLDTAMKNLKAEIRAEIGKEFDAAMNQNFASLNKAMTENKDYAIAYAEKSSVDIIAKFDKILGAKSTELEAKITKLEETIKVSIEGIKKASSS